MRDRATDPSFCAWSAFSGGPPMTLNLETISPDRAFDDIAVIPLQAAPNPSIRFPLSLKQRHRVMVGLDALVLNLSLWVTLTSLDSTQGLTSLAKTWIDYPWIFLLANAFWFLMAPATDVYEPERVATFRSPPLKLAGMVVGVIALTAAITSLAPTIAPEGKPQILLIAVGVVSVAMAATRLTAAAILSNDLFKERVLIVGTGLAAIEFAQLARKKLSHSIEAVGFVNDGIDGPSEVVRVMLNDSASRTLEGMTVVGGLEDLALLIEAHEIDSVVISSPRYEDSIHTQLALACIAQDVEMVHLAAIYEQLTTRVPTSLLDEDWTIGMSVSDRSSSLGRRVAKRLFDLVAASFALILLLPFLPFVALAIRLDSEGPVFYKQERAGRYGKSFFVYKLRSMIADSEPNGPVWAEEDDPRITRVGRILRKTHLDEFPQLINIIRGEMSAVGPRPERPSFDLELSQTIAFYELRYAVRPGMAGWGLVKQGYGSSAEDALLKLQYDLYYIKNQSVRLDIGIILKTIADTMTVGGR